MVPILEKLSLTEDGKLSLINVTHLVCIFTLVVRGPSFEIVLCFFACLISSLVKKYLQYVSNSSKLESRLEKIESQISALNFQSGIKNL